MLCGQNVFSIFTGDAKAMNLKAIYADSFNPLDLTSCTEIVVSILNADGSYSQFKFSESEVTIGSPEVLGNFSVTAAAMGAASSLFAVGELQNFTVAFTISSLVQTVEYLNCFSVFQSP